jgi:excisionase family DNA binding protein
MPGYEQQHCQGIAGEVESAGEHVVFNTKEAAAFLKTSELVIQREAKFGNIPGRKLSNQWRFSKQALLEWLKGDDPMIEEVPWLF